MKNFHTLLWFVLFLGGILLPYKSHAQLKAYQFEQIDSLQIIEKRKIVVFIHTDWCKYCQAMKNTTFKNKDIIDLLNNKFYFIVLNAEEKQTIHYQGKKFEYKPRGNRIGIHQLATELATINDFISYPTITFLNDKNEILFQQNDFISNKELIEILNFVDSKK